MSVFNDPDSGQTSPKNQRVFDEHLGNIIRKSAEKFVFFLEIELKYDRTHKFHGQTNGVPNVSSHNNAVLVCWFANDKDIPLCSATILKYLIDKSGERHSNEPANSAATHWFLHGGWFEVNPA